MSRQGIECGPCALSLYRPLWLTDRHHMQRRLVMSLLLVATQLLAIAALLALYIGWLA